jgi:radical SAM protein with 4Fe4S-binding SPASM domain
MEQGGDFFDRIGLGQRRTPVSASMGLTFRCNLRCAHCYLGDHRGGQSNELSTAEIFDLFDQMAAAGTLWLLLTGGEPLVRPDFREIYASAKNKGFIVTLFTNGTLLTPEMADFLADLPPHNIEITLYGATRLTYDQVTQVKGSYDRCMRAIDLLMARSIPLKLKAMAMTSTVAEIPAMKTFARGLGLEFHFDPMLNNDLDQGQTPFPFRLPPGEVARLDLDDPARCLEWQDFYHQQSEIPVNTSFLYNCGAGINSYHIDPFGHLSLCMGVRDHSFDLRLGNFKEGWDNYILQERLTPAVEIGPCASCKLQPLCGQCPAWAESECAGPGEPIQYLCQIGHSRAKALGLID